MSLRELPKSARLAAFARSSTIPYLIIVIISIVVGQFFLYLDYGQPRFKGQSLSIIIQFSLLPISLTFWFWAPKKRQVSVYFKWAIYLMIAMWILGSVQVAFRSESVNYTYLLTPIILLLILRKPPSYLEAKWIAVFTGYLFMATFLAAQIFHILGFREFRDFILNRWLSFPGGAYRWEGMFGDPNNAGFIAAFLVILGFGISGKSRFVFITVGAFTLFATESRSAILAAILGLILLAYVRLENTRLLNSKIQPVVVLFLGFSLVLVVAIVIDPSLNGRVPIWKSSFDLWLTEPFLGIGTQGMRTAAETGLIPWGNIDGHSVLVDALTRYGVLAFALSAAIFIFAFIGSWRMRVKDAGLTLALLVTFLATANTYSITNWIYVGVQTLPLIIVLLLASSSGTKSVSATWQESKKR